MPAPSIKEVRTRVRGKGRGMRGVLHLFITPIGLLAGVLVLVLVLGTQLLSVVFLYRIVLLGDTLVWSRGHC